MENKIDPLSIIAGIIFTLGGLALLITSLFFWPAVFYSVPILIIGIVILATLKKQEYIEPIKERNKKRRLLAKE